MRAALSKSKPDTTKITRNIVDKLSDRELYAIFRGRLALKLSPIDWSEFEGVWENKTVLETLRNVEEKIAIEESGSSSWTDVFLTER